MRFPRPVFRFYSALRRHLPHQARQHLGGHPGGMDGAEPPVPRRFHGGADPLGGGQSPDRLQAGHPRLVRCRVLFEARHGRPRRADPDAPRFIGRDGARRDRAVFVGVQGMCRVRGGDGGEEDEGGGVLGGGVLLRMRGLARPAAGGRRVVRPALLGAADRAAFVALNSRSFAA